MVRQHLSMTSGVFFRVHTVTSNNEAIVYFYILKVIFFKIIYFYFKLIKNILKNKKKWRRPLKMDFQN